MSSRSLPYVVEEHASEAAFHWLLRNAAVSQPHFALRHVAHLDGMLDAQLDGLREAGEAGWEACRDQLSTDEPGEVFAAAVLAFESNDPARIGIVMEKAVGEAGLSAAIVSSLGWLTFEQARPHVSRLLREQSPSLRRAGLGGALAHRATLGPALAEAIADGDPRLSARALRGIGELGRLDLLPLAEHYLQAENPHVRSCAAWSATVLSTQAEALGALAAIAQSKSPHREWALETAMRRAEPSAAKNWCRNLAKEADTVRLAVRGAGAAGDPSEVPWLIEQMKLPALARAAGESFTTITGVDIAYEDLEGERPEDFESGPTEDPADEDVEMDPDENLPWPDPELIQKWWQSNRHSYKPGTRYLHGQAITVDWCKQVLRIGRQRQRAAAALELAMRQPATPLFEVRAPGFRQKQLLGL